MILAATIVVALILLNPSFELSYLVYIFSGIGVGPLIIQLLNLNTQSKVHISTILEKGEVYVANGLAWSYYLCYLRQALPKFTQAINNYDEQTQLSLKKLILLITHDCRMEDLNALDQKIERLSHAGNDQDRFRIYRLTTEKNEHKYFAIEYVENPLKTLREMREREDAHAVTKGNLEEEVKLLYRTLSEILRNTQTEACREKCLLVAIRATNPKDLRNGGLVKCIMDEVQHSERTQVDGAHGFVKPKETSCLSKRNPGGRNKQDKGKGRKGRQSKEKYKALQAAENQDLSDTHTHTPDEKPSESVTQKATDMDDNAYSSRNTSSQMINAAGESSSDHLTNIEQEQSEL